MSYSFWTGIPRWVSDFTYKALYERLKVPTRQMKAASGESTGRLLISGIISRSRSTASLRPIYRLDASNFGNAVDDGPTRLSFRISRVRPW